jgi:tetratricopeptide (TPR) repeat protein
MWTGALAIASGTIGLLVFIPVSKEDRAYVALAFTQFNDSQGKEVIKEHYSRLSDFTLLYPEKLDKIVGNLVQGGLSEEVGIAAKNLYANDTNDVFAINLLASYYRNYGELTNELNLRERIRQLDPWNEKLEFALAQVYADLGDVVKLKVSIERLKSLGPDSVEYQEATLLLEKLTANP